MNNKSTVVHAKLNRPGVNRGLFDGDETKNIYSQKLQLFWDRAWGRTKDPKEITIQTINKTMIKPGVFSETEGNLKRSTVFAMLTFWNLY